MGGGSGGNFDEQLPIDSQGRLSPTGPLTESDNTMQHIYVWVVQIRDDGSAAAHISRQDPGGFPQNERVWTTDPAKSIHHGEFHPGPAVGLALGVATTPPPENATNMSWWSDTISLVPGGSQSTPSSSAEGNDTATAT